MVNSIRLFIYGFIISFIIVIFDRAFFGTRKRSDTQFLNLFLTITSILTFCYTFSPFFRMVEFEISHPKWKSYEIIDIQSHSSNTVYSFKNFLEKKYTPITVYYKDHNQKMFSFKNEVKHYGLLIVPPLRDKEALEKELNFIHQRSVDKLIEKQAIHVYEHPHKEKLKVFKGNDAFAIRHSIGFLILQLVCYLLALIGTIHLLKTRRTICQRLFSTVESEKRGFRIFLTTVVAIYIILGTVLIHYMKFV